MAEKVQTFSKVECRSKQAVTSITNAISDNVKKILLETTLVSIEDRDRCISRFREIYEAAMQQNILIDGEEWSEARHNETSEFEPVDMERKNFISKELLPHLDDTIVDVTLTRKFHPQLCEKEVYNTINKHGYYSAKVAVTDPEREVFSPKPGVSLLAENKLREDVETAASRLNSLTKNVTSTVEKAEKLKTAVSIFQQSSKTDRIIFEEQNRNGDCDLKMQIS